MTRRLRFGDVGSTNTVALERVRDGERPPFWVTATRQLAGRGRLGRSWVSEPGNLYATLTLSEPAAPERLPTLSIVTATAARRAIEIASGATALEVKWPNDILLDGAKVAGILLEAHLVDGERVVCIGCGVNCRSHPEHTAYPATNLATAGYPVKPDRLFASLDDSMDAALAAWHRGERTQPFLDEWLANAHGRDGRVSVGTPGGRVSGTLRGIDGTGRLLLDTDNGRMTITAGDLEAPRTE